MAYDASIFYGADILDPISTLGYTPTSAQIAKQSAPLYTLPTSVGASDLAAAAAGLGMAATLPFAQTAETPAPVVTPTSVIPAVTGAAGALGLSLPTWLPALLGAAGAGYAIYQGLGGGEGGGIGGINLLGGDEYNIPGTDITVGGPGLPEPGPGTGWNVLKTWVHTYDWGKVQFYYIQKIGGRKSDRYVAYYNTRTKAWGAYKLRRPMVAVIGKNMPKHKQIVRLRRLLGKQSADARTILRITSPTSLKGYYKTRRRR